MIMSLLLKRTEYIWSITSHHLHHSSPSISMDIAPSSCYTRKFNEGESEECGGEMCVCVCVCVCEYLYVYVCAGDLVEIVVRLQQDAIRYSSEVFPLSI